MSLGACAAAARCMASSVQVQGYGVDHMTFFAGQYPRTTKKRLSSRGKSHPALALESEQILPLPHAHGRNEPLGRSPPLTPSLPPSPIPCISHSLFPSPGTCTSLEPLRTVLPVNGPGCDQIPRQSHGSENHLALLLLLFFLPSTLSPPSSPLLQRPSDLVYTVCKSREVILSKIKILATYPPKGAADGLLRRRVVEHPDVAIVNTANGSPEERRGGARGPGPPQPGR